MLDDDNKFKLRISRIFHGSCMSRNDVDVDVLLKSPLLSPRSIFNPRTTTPSHHITKTSNDVLPNLVRPIKSRSRSKSTVDSFSHLSYNPFYDRAGSRYSAAVKDNHENNKKKYKKKTKKISNDHDFFSSDDEREDDNHDDETLFSSRNLSSENRDRSRKRGKDTMGVRGSMAVVKKSRDPYGDFRRSMLEMIIEMQIFGEKELEQLLLCFLSLNSIRLHNIIVHVFNEILDALFSM